MTLAGLAVGLCLAASATRAMTSLLYGFVPASLPTAIVVSVIVLAVSALACLVPARRASRINPMVALRHNS